MKTVCIIGAGPAGLVAAKTLLHNHPQTFNIIIFEKSDILGGIWAFSDPKIPNRYLNSKTPTNLSRHTVGFSDLAWQSVDLGDAKLPIFPGAWMAGRYLETYERKYVPEGTIKFGERVTLAEHVDGEKQWRITTERKGEKETKTSTFDYLINAAGFFNKPRGFQPRIPSSSSVKPVHTSLFRSLDDLSLRPGIPQKILIFGGGNSSGETAANVAFQLSSSQHSKSGADRERFQDTQIYHITPRPLYAVPPFVPKDHKSCTFTPVDLKLYDLPKRGPGPIESGAGRQVKEFSELIHSVIEGIVGDQRDLNAPALISEAGPERGTARVALSESYSEFVRSGLIKPIAGRVTALEQGKDIQEVTATVKSTSGDETRIESITAVIYATGYTPSSAFNFLSDNVKKALEYDETSTRLPLILEQYQTFSPKVPDLAFVGFYEGPYWGIMEMQARLVAQRWANKTKLPEKAFEHPVMLRELRKAIKDGASNVPQYWFGDYLGYMEEMARELGLERMDEPFGAEREGVVSPARYLTSYDDHEEAKKIMKDLKQNSDEAVKGRWRARAVFRGLQGDWKMQRRIESKLPEMPSGEVVGSAVFHPREPTSPEADFEYLCHEQGTFTTTKNFTMETRRSWVYRYSEAKDTLSVWFVKPDDRFAVDYLYHELVFGEVGKEEGVCEANSDHHCEPDFYVTDYRFKMDRVALEMFNVLHTVTGPHKDYTSDTEYRR